MKLRTAGTLLFCLLARAGAAQEDVFSHTYVRGIGAPVTVSFSFVVCDTVGPYTVIVANGPAGAPKAGSGSVTLNGTEIIHPADFSRQVDQIERPMANLAANNQIDVRLAGAPGGTILVTVRRTQSCGIRITSPTGGSTVTGPEVIVRGTYPSSFGQDVGVTVNGFLGMAGGGRFAALVPVDPSVTTLTAVARDGGGTILDDDTIPITVQAGPPESAVSLRASPSLGLVTLSSELTLVSNVAVTQVTVDKDGDGVIDFTGPSLDGVRFTYPQPGVFLATATATTPAGPRSASVIVQALDRPTLEGMLQARWAAMKNALRDGDIDGALLFISTTAREKYRDAFVVIAADLSDIDSILPAITFARAWGPEVVFQMERTDDGVVKSFEVHFAVDADGVWRLRAF